MRHAICYISNSSKELDKNQLHTLLEYTRERNISLGIKGVLLFSDGHFFQIIEGEKDVVLEVFSKIEKDSRHNGIITIINMDIPQNTYDDYMVDILNDNRKMNYKLPNEYNEALNGISLDMRKTMEKILEKFISSS